MNNLKPENADERLWAMISHSAAFAGLLFPLLGSVLGPLLVWLVKKQESTYLDFQGKKAVNFQITIMIIVLVIAVISYIFFATSIIAYILSFIGLIFAAIAGIKVHKTGDYNYPFSFKFIK